MRCDGVMYDVVWSKKRVQDVEWSQYFCLNHGEEVIPSDSSTAKKEALWKQIYSLEVLIKKLECKRWDKYKNEYYHKFIATLQVIQ